MKICSNKNCSKQNPQLIENFNKRSNRKSGLQSICKTCQSIKYNQWLENNKAYNYNRKNTWRKQNQGYVNSYDATRKLSKLKATPKWLTEQQLKEIELIYDRAKELNEVSNSTGPFEVDHIVPIKGKNICGLHVPWNLQILPKYLNNKKSNKC